MQHMFSKLYLGSVLFILFIQSAVAQYIEWDTLTVKHPFLMYSADKLPELRQRIASDTRTRNLYLQILNQSRNRSDVQITRSRIAKSGAFVLAVGLKEDGTALDLAEIQSLTGMLHTYFHEIDPTVQANSSEYQWRSVELMQFCEAYDFYRGYEMSADTTVERTLATFAEGMQRELRSPIVLHNNLTLKLAAALGMASLTLKGSELPDVRRKTEDWFLYTHRFIHDVLNKYQGTFALNGYSEGPYYFRYAMMSLLPFFQACNNAIGFDDYAIAVNGSLLGNMLYTPGIGNLTRWIASLRLPDGRLPAFEDTYMDTRFPEFATIAQLGLRDTLAAWRNYSGTASLTDDALFAALSETYDSRIEYLCAGAKELDTPPSTPRVSFMPEAGYVVYRSSWSPDATYFALIGKYGVARTGGSTFGSGHKHANETGFIMASGGELLAIEPGYYQYSYRDSLIYGKNHNIILVDGKGPDQTSILNFLIGADTYIEDTLSSQWGSVSTASTTYQDATISRTSVFFNNKFVILKDIVTSNAPHRFTHQIHGNGLESAGTFSMTAPGTCVWQSGNERLFANVTATAQALSYETPVRKHAPSYMKFEDHTALYSSANGTAATFQTMLVPAPVPASAVFQEVDSAFNAHAVSCVVGSDIFVSAVAQSNAPFSVKTALGAIESDAQFGIIGADQTTEVTLFLEKAKACSLNGKPVFASNAPATLFTHIAAKSIDLTLRSVADVVFSIYLGFEPDTITGQGFKWSMNGNRLVVTSAGGRAEMRIHLSNTPTGVENPGAMHTTDEFDIYPNPVTASADGIHLVNKSNYTGRNTISIYNSLGTKIISVDAENIQGESKPLFIPLHSIPKGLYIMEFTSSSGTQRKAFIVQ